MASVGNDGTDARRGMGSFLHSHVGFVPNPLSRRSKTLGARITDAQVSISVCPYCGVGCSQRVYHRDGKVIDIEGNPDSPVNGGHLCPKGASTYQLGNNPNRPTKVLYRAPRSDHWEERPLEWAMGRVAQLVKQTRDATFQLYNDEGVRVNRTAAIGHIGGATARLLWPADDQAPDVAVVHPVLFLPGRYS